jgi:hypothetical protein
MSLQLRGYVSLTQALVKWPIWIAIGLACFAAPVTSFAVVNPDCTLIVPASPLSAAGLATPYKLVATNPANGPCHETNTDQSAFVEAAIINLITGQISIYHPLVVDAGTVPAAPPVVPPLPFLSAVALWFGYNGDNLTLSGAVPNVLTGADCHQNMGQFAYCNASAFFASANLAILFGSLHVPAIGNATDGLPCPTVRHFMVVDQDQSDNLPTTYLITPTGTLAQDNAANRAAIPGFTVLGNPSDNRLLDLSIDPALGCTAWAASDLTNPGHTTPALALNELQAAAYQAAPLALIPLGDPFVLNDLNKVNEYRQGVNQFPALFAAAASTTTYCTNLRAINIQRLNLDRPQLTAFASPKPAVANSLFTFLANRLFDSYEILGCQALTGQLNPAHLTKNGAGVVTAATIN